MNPEQLEPEDNLVQCFHCRSQVEEDSTRTHRAFVYCEDCYD